MVEALLGLVMGWCGDVANDDNVPEDAPDDDVMDVFIGPEEDE